MITQEQCDEVFDYLNFYIEAVENTETWYEQCKQAEQLVDYYIGAACCELFVSMELDAFFHHLIRSAQTRLWALENAEKNRRRDKPQIAESIGRVDKHYRQIAKSSNLDGYFCALAAGQTELAKRIIKYTPKLWFENIEYEDDFFYAQFHYSALMGESEETLNSILLKLEAALEGGESARLALCKAFLSRDAAQCELGFEALVSAYDDYLEGASSLTVYEEALFQVRMPLFVEGLAWLKLLESRGVYLETEFKYCPGVARTPSYAPFEISTFPYQPV